MKGKLAAIAILANAFGLSQSWRPMVGRQAAGWDDRQATDQARRATKLESVRLGAFLHNPNRLLNTNRLWELAIASQAPTPATDPSDRARRPQRPTPAFENRFRKWFSLGGAKLEAKLTIASSETSPAFSSERSHLILSNRNFLHLRFCKDSLRTHKGITISSE